MKTIDIPASDLYIYAYPAQMLVFQLVRNNKILTNENCFYEDIIPVISKYLHENPINNIFIIGKTSFTDKIETIIKDTFDYYVNNIERIKEGL